MANHYLRKLRQNTYHGETMDGSDPLYHGVSETYKEGLSNVAKMAGGVLVGVVALIAAPNIYRWIKGEKVFKQASSNIYPQLNTIPSFNKQHQMRPLERQVVQLLQQSKNAYDSQGSVNDIVEPFAVAQEMIHSPQFKSDYQSDPVKMQIVEDFASLGTELGG